jgi:hypothetical protein
VVGSTASSAATAAAASSAAPPPALSNDPDRRAALLAAKLRAFVGAQWGLPDPAEVGTSVVGASLADRDGGRTWVLLDDDPARRLGMALALALRHGPPGAGHHLHLITDDGDAAGVLARRAAELAAPVDVWHARGSALEAAIPAEPAVDAAPPPEAELYRPVLAAAGLEPVVEGGALTGELLGLEVARVVVADDGEAHLEAGVGRFDREAGAMMFAHLGETDALARAVDIVRAQRSPGAAHHPLHDLVPERWLRSVVVARPELVGASRLRAVGSALPRRNLREVAVATAVGTDAAGDPMVVVCSTGVDLDLVPAAVDDRLTHHPGARLVLVVPAADALGITRDLAALVRGGAEVVTVDGDWRQALDEAG